MQQIFSKMLHVLNMLSLESHSEIFRRMSAQIANKIQIYESLSPGDINLNLKYAKTYK